MRIFIFHYHLNPGGVTRIIESQVAGMKKENPNLEIYVVCGYCENEAYYNDLGINLLVNSKLNYLVDKEFAKAELQVLFNELYSWILALLEPNDVLHVHNLNLGKNPVLTLVFNKLNSEGYLLMNHAHDFAEDRPVNIQYMQKIITEHFNLNLAEVMYPNRNNYLVGVLNNSDYQRILEIGVPEQRLFLFPNPVHMPMDMAPQKSKNSAKLRQVFNISDTKKVITYPVRVIQRKNIGELILLAVLFKDSCQFLVTMPPRNPVEIEFYEQWLQFCATYDIPIIFEAGKHMAFIELLSGSDYCITTSIQEGFGMTYLEPWLVETPVIGRNLAYVTVDIVNQGVVLSGLYNTLQVPFFNTLVDFKDLSVDKQQQFIRKVLKEPQLVESVLDVNEKLQNFPQKISTFEITQNKKTIKNNFSIKTYAKRIFESYKTVPE